jgi:adenylate cyclase
MNSKAKVVFYLIIIIFVFVLYYFNIFLPLENKVYDFLILLRYIFSPEISKDIVIVIVDDFTIEKLGKWPLPRRLYAEAISNLEESGVKAIGLDIILSDYSNEKNDYILEQELKKYNNIVLPVVYEMKLIRSLHSSKLEITKEEKPLNIFTEKSRLGNINFIPDRDGIIRRLNFFKDDRAYLP